MHTVWLERRQSPVGFAWRRGRTHLVKQAGLHREGLIQKFLVEGLLGVMHHDDSHPLPIILGAPCPAHHLEHICDGKVHITPAHTFTQSASAVCHGNKHMSSVHTQLNSPQDKTP